jgi:hypothetical protein
MCRLQLKPDGTRWRTWGGVKGKLANGVGSQYSSHYLGTRCIQHYYRWCAQLGCTAVDWTDAPADLNGLVRFAEGRSMVSERVPSHFKRSLLQSNPDTAPPLHSSNGNCWTEIPYSVLLRFAVTNCGEPAVALYLVWPCVFPPSCFFFDCFTLKIKVLLARVE